MSTPDNNLTLDPILLSRSKKKLNNKKTMKEITIIIENNKTIFLFNKSSEFNLAC